MTELEVFYGPHITLYTARIRQQIKINSSSSPMFFMFTHHVPPRIIIIAINMRVGKAWKEVEALSPHHSLIVFTLFPLSEKVTSEIQREEMMAANQTKEEVHDEGLHLLRQRINQDFYRPQKTCAKAEQNIPSSCGQNNILSLTTSTVTRTDTGR